MVAILRHGEDCPNEELCTIAARWCGMLEVRVDWRRARITIVCCVAYFQPCRWTSGDFSWLVMMGAY
jgi:hypothetical protein